MARSPQPPFEQDEAREQRGPCGEGQPDRPGPTALGQADERPDQRQEPGARQGRARAQSSGAVSSGSARLSRTARRAR